MESKECLICGNDYSSDLYYEIDGETLCSDCVMDLCEREFSLEESSFTQYYLGGDFIGDENDDVCNIIEQVLDYVGKDYKKLED